MDESWGYASAQRHENNIRGTRSDTSLISLGENGDPHWLIFKLVNQTNQTQWILDFGKQHKGRTGFIDQLYVYDKTNNIAFLNALKSKDNAGSNTAGLPGTSLPITLNKRIKPYV